MWVSSLGQEDPLEEGRATGSSILAWRIPWTGESGGLQPMEQLSPCTTTIVSGLESLLVLSTEAHVPGDCALQEGKPSQ